MIEYVWYKIYMKFSESVLLLGTTRSAEDKKEITISVLKLKNKFNYLKDYVLRL